MLLISLYILIDINTGRILANDTDPEYVAIFFEKFLLMPSLTIHCHVPRSQLLKLASGLPSDRNCLVFASKVYICLAARSFHHRTCQIVRNVCTTACTEDKASGNILSDLIRKHGGYVLVSTFAVSRIL